MRKLLFAAVIAVFTMTSMSAQTKAVKVNPLGIAFGIGNAGFEFTTTESQSLTISALYFKVSEIKGLGAGLEYKFYFDGQAIEGWYAAPVAGFLSLEEDFTNTDGSIFTVGGEVGHQWVFGDHFALDLNAGYSVYVGGDDLSSLDGGGFGLGLSLGYAW